MTYWIRFAGEPWLQHSYGVTAYSLEDALALIQKRRAGGPVGGPPVEVTDVGSEDLDQRHVVPNCVPMVFRGVWFPRFNLGDDAP